MKKHFQLITIFLTFKLKWRRSEMHDSLFANYLLVGN